MLVGVTTLARALLFFWALWLSIVALTNVLNGLQVLALLPDTFRFVSGNWSWINGTLDPLDVPRPLQALMFTAAILWEALAAMLYWRALVAYRGRSLAQEPAVIAASAVNLGLWAAFQVLDEVFLAYEPQAVHRDIFASQLLTILTLCVLPVTTKASEPGQGV